MRTTLSAAFVFLWVLAFPAVSFAASGTFNDSYIKGYADSIKNVINGILIPVLMAVALLVFVYGVYKYFILGAADGKAHTEGRNLVIYSVIGFVCIFSIWALVALVNNTFGLDSTTLAPDVPKL